MWDKAKKILKEFKPDIVIGTGGYICVSVCIAASQLKIPIVLHESNAFPGVAVKVMAKKADEILLGFEEAKERIPNARKIVVTGTPTKVNSNRLSDEQKYNLKQEILYGLEQETMVYCICKAIYITLNY